MKLFIYWLKIFILKDRGASATEYGLIIAGTAIALIFVFSVVTGAFNDGFQYILQTLNNAFGK
ncbi:MAG: Flp family type IVb pilin [Actinobacteria bacterium]|nr:Flp family type IVb pilin [Actinomycetota bacterium]